MFATVVTQTPLRIQSVEKIKSRGALLQPTPSFSQFRTSLFYSDLNLVELENEQKHARRVHPFTDIELKWENT